MVEEEVVEDDMLMLDDKKDGYGIIYYENGNKKYEGDFKNNKKHGKGTSFFPDGNMSD